MKTFNFKFLNLAIALFATLTLSQVASAGKKYDSEVYVSSGSASGSFHDARNSSDNTQYIGCQVQTSTYGSFNKTITCTANNRNGEFFYCFIDNRGNETAFDRAVEAMRMINDSSWIHVAREGYYCKYFSVVNSSVYLP